MTDALPDKLVAGIVDDAEALAADLAARPAQRTPYRPDHLPPASEAGGEWRDRVLAAQRPRPTGVVIRNGRRAVGEVAIGLTPEDLDASGLRPWPEAGAHGPSLADVFD